MDFSPNGTAVEVDDVPVEIKRQIVQQEIQLWRNTRYQFEVRLRVEKRIGGTPEAQAEHIRQLETCEKRLDALQAELEAL
jgi:hypothetical protein